MGGRGAIAQDPPADNHTMKESTTILTEYLRGRNMGSLAKRFGITVEEARKEIRAHGYLIAGVDAEAYSRQHFQAGQHWKRVDSLKPDKISELMKNWGASDKNS